MPIAGIAAPSFERALAGGFSPNSAGWAGIFARENLKAGIDIRFTKDLDDIDPLVYDE
jgi:hypothetical protein